MNDKASRQFLLRRLKPRRQPRFEHSTYLFHRHFDADVLLPHDNGRTGLTQMGLILKRRTGVHNS